MGILKNVVSVKRIQITEIRRAGHGLWAMNVAGKFLKGVCMTWGCVVQNICIQFVKNGHIWKCFQKEELSILICQENYVMYVNILIIFLSSKLTFTLVIFVHTYAHAYIHTYILHTYISMYTFTDTHTCCTYPNCVAYSASKMTILYYMARQSCISAQLCKNCYLTFASFDKFWNLKMINIYTSSVVPLVRLLFIV